MKRIRSLITVLCGMALGATSVLATDRHVPSPYATIQEAIDAATNGDTVIVADGTYTGPGNRDIQFFGKAITVRSSNGRKRASSIPSSLGGGSISSTTKRMTR